MLRRRIAIAAFVAAVPIAAGLLSACGDAPTPRAVLLITIDTCRADRFGCYGGDVSTPTVDALAAQGTLFLQASAPTPITLPSHLSILTGLYPDRHTVRDNGAGPLPTNARTLAELLEGEGWATAAFLSAVPLDSSFGVAQGFEHYDDDFLQLPPSGDVMSRLDQDQRVAADVTALAIDWVRSAAEDDRPWLAWVHYFDPHSPYTPPAEFAGGDGSSPYDGEVAYVDRQIGRLLDIVGDDALIVVVADHGESLGEHNERTHGFFVYESALRVPWLLRGPGVPAGRRVETSVSIVRVLPTILDLLGISAPADLDGPSARPLFAAPGRDSEQRHDTSSEPVFAEALFPRLHFGWSATRSVRHQGWKLIEGPELELYDLRTDPDEQRNVADAHPDVVQQLRALLHEHADRGGELSAAPASEIDAEMRARLEGLGYIGAGAPTDPNDDLWDFDRRHPRDMIDVFREIERLPQAVLSGTREEADAFVERLRQRDPGNAEILRSIARLRLRAGHLDAAAETSREILSLRPDDVEAWRTLATAQLRAGDTTAAIGTIDATLARAPDDVSGRLLLAKLLSARGRTSDALREYDRVLELSPSHGTAVYEKGVLLSSQGRTDDAVRLLRQHLPALSDDVDILNNLAWLLANESIDPEEALVHARRARTLAPDDPVVLDTFGWAAVRSGHPDEAIAPLRRALELTGDAEVRAHLGIALTKAGQREQGREQVRAALEERPALRSIPEVAAIE